METKPAADRKAATAAPKPGDEYTLDPVLHRYGCNVCDGRGLALNNAGICRDCQEAR